MTSPPPRPPKRAQTEPVAQRKARLRFALYAVAAWEIAVFVALGVGCFKRHTASHKGNAPPPLAQAKSGAVVGIGSWNLEWFGLSGKRPRSDADIRATAGVIRRTGVSLLGLNEIENAEALDALIRYLPGWRYVLGATGRAQRCAVLYDARRVRLTARPTEWPDVNQGIEKEPGSLRAPLVAPLQIGKFDFLLVVVHNKAMFDARSVQARHSQMRNLRARLDEWSRNHREKDIVAVGDYNDFADSAALAELTGAGRNALGGAAYVNAGARLPPGAITHMRPDSRIDHIIIASPVTERSEWTGEAFTLPPPPGDARDDYEAHISDHLPTWATFKTSRDDD